MEEGRLTDSFGRNVDFKNTIIIMTTNAGAEVTSYTNIFGFDRGRDDAASYEQMKERLKVAIEKYFRPEFLNRLDDVIVFHAPDQGRPEADRRHRAGQGPQAAERPGPEAGPDRRGQGVPDQEGLQPRLRRPAAAPGDREPDRGPALRGAAPRLASRARTGSTSRSRARDEDRRFKFIAARPRTRPRTSPPWSGVGGRILRGRRQERLTPGPGKGNRIQPRGPSRDIPFS